MVEDQAQGSVRSNHFEVLIENLAVHRHIPHRRHPEMGKAPFSPLLCEPLHYGLAAHQAPIELWRIRQFQRIVLHRQHHWACPSLNALISAASRYIMNRFWLLIPFVPELLVGFRYESAFVSIERTWPVAFVRAAQPLRTNIREKETEPCYYRHLEGCEVMFSVELIPLTRTTRFILLCSYLNHGKTTTRTSVRLPVKMYNVDRRWNRFSCSFARLCIWTSCLLDWTAVNISDIDISTSEANSRWRCQRHRRPVTVLVRSNVYAFVISYLWPSHELDFRPKHIFVVLTITSAKLSHLVRNNRDVVAANWLSCSAHLPFYKSKYVSRVESSARTRMLSIVRHSFRSIYTIMLEFPFARYPLIRQFA